MKEEKKFHQTINLPNVTYLLDQDAYNYIRERLRLDEKTISQLSELSEKTTRTIISLIHQEPSFDITPCSSQGKLCLTVSRNYKNKNYDDLLVITNHPSFDYFCYGLPPQPSSSEQPPISFKLTSLEDFLE